MPKITGRGVLIAVEGIDGAGKTTQVHLLADALRRAGEDVITSKEPTNGPWGRKIRESASTGRLPLEEELEAFTQDRLEHVQHTIIPALTAEKIVILDRYFYSTIAYQGARGADIEMLDRTMREIAPVPDVVYLLDLDPSVAISRIQKRDSPNEFEKVDSLSAVRAVFKKLWEIDQDLWEVEGDLPADVVHVELVRHLYEHTLREKRCAKEYGCVDPYHCAPRLTQTCDWWEMGHELGTQWSDVRATGLRKLAFSR